MNKLITIIKLWLKRTLILLDFLTKKSRNNDKIVVIDLKSSNRFSRDLVNPVQFFLLNKYSVFFRLRLNFIRQLSFYYKLISKRKEVSIILIRPNKYTFYISNSPEKEGDIMLKEDLTEHQDYVKNSFRLPYSMHPLSYENQQYEKLLQLRNLQLKIAKRKYRIVFAGNLNENEYKSFYWGNEYYESRVKLVEFILKKFGKKVIIPKSFVEYEAGIKVPICIVSRKYFSLDMMSYFKFLSQGNFSFCPPGIRQPFCHNLIESMFMGSIPILKYAHLLNPKLQDGVNCLIYDDITSLINTVEKAISMSEAQVMEMKMNVCSYYKHYLEPNAVIKNFEDSIMDNVNTIYISAGT